MVIFKLHINKDMQSNLNITMKEYNIQKWLNSKVCDDSIETSYEDNNYVLNPHSDITEHMRDFYKYYSGEDDQDVTNSENIYINSINTIKEIDKDELNNEPELLFLNYYVERYTTNENKLVDYKIKRDNKWMYDNNQKQTVDKALEEKVRNVDINEIDILIFPNSNRYHANYLFKQLVDCSDEYNMNYYLGDVQEEKIKFIDVDFKNKFYEWCYENTTKKRIYNHN
jgi:hypothetical protein